MKLFPSIAYSPMAIITPKNAQEYQIHKNSVNKRLPNPLKIGT
jgi:hypothetical protein